MAVSIIYRMVFENLDENITKLGIMDRLLDSIGRKGGVAGALGGKGGAAGTGGGNNIVVPPGTAGAASGGLVEGAAGAVAATKGISTSFMQFEKSLTELGFNIKSAEKSFSALPKIRLAEAQLKQLESIANPSEIQKARIAVKQDQIEQLWSKYLDVNNPQKKDPESKGGNWFSNFWKEFTKKGENSEGINKESIRELMKGAGIGRELRTLALSFGKLGPVIAAVVIGLLALREAVKLLVEGIKTGTEAYRDAAKEGMSVRQTDILKKAFAEIGMNVPNLGNTKYLLNGKNDADTILMAAKSGMLGEQGQQLVNMADEFRTAMKDAERSATQMSITSAANSEVSTQALGVSREWHTLLSQISGIIAPLISDFLSSLKEVFGIINDVVEIYNNLKFLNPVFWALKGVGIIISKFAEMIHFATSQLARLSEWILSFLPDAFKHFLGIGPGTKQNEMIPEKSTASTTAWEKMGLIFGNSSGPDKELHNISTNTFNCVVKLDKMITLMNGNLGYKSSFPDGPIHLPQLP